MVRGNVTKFLVVAANWFGWWCCGSLCGGRRKGDDGENHECLQGAKWRILEYLCEGIRSLWWNQCPVVISMLVVVWWFWAFASEGGALRTWSKNHTTLVLTSVSSYSLTPCPLPGVFEFGFVQIFKRLPQAPNTPRCRGTIPTEQWLWSFQILYIKICATGGKSSAQ